jgi:hypothetical protein
MDEFLKSFFFGGGYMALASKTPVNVGFIQLQESFSLLVNPDNNAFFSPAMRKTQGNEKTDVLGSKAVWVDVDEVQQPQCTLPPSAIVSSGHGWHFYWFLKTPLLDTEALEELNKTMIADIPPADHACWNCNRVMRVPGTMNLKPDKEPIRAELKLFKPTLLYDVQDFNIIAQLAKNMRHKIRTGDSRGHKSRSERDWSIVMALVVAGATDELITTIFENQPCGDKHHDEPAHYLLHTIEEVRASPKVEVRRTQAKAPVDIDIVEQEDGYYATARNGLRRVSTFIIHPTVLLDGSAFDAQDAIVGDVVASGYNWNSVTFSRGAFTSVPRMDKESPVAAWQWIGHDDDIRRLLPFLLKILQDNGLPKIAATPILGLHRIKGKWIFLGDAHAIDSDSVYQGFTGPLCWLPSQREHPKMNLSVDLAQSDLGRVRELLPKLNAPEAIWPMIGWYSASCLKPWFETKNYRFPVLNVAGTKGSGKTSLIQRIFMPLMGQTDAKTYDSGTTRFVTLALLGSSNAVPIAFSEFRYELVERFIRFILLAYDTGHDPRGKGDQTTVDYPLSAPFSVDGEDLVEDPAARERLVAVVLHPTTIDEGSEAYQAFQQLRESVPPNYGGYFIQQVLKREGRLDDFLQQARDAMFQAFPGKLPDRVRNNYTVCFMGMRLWCDILGAELPDASILKPSISTVFDLASGRAKTLADSLVEDVVNAVAQGHGSFPVSYQPEPNILWFQLSPAHSWWITSRRRQGRGALERDAIRSQLKEAPYSVTPQVLNDAWMYGVDLQKAYEQGLDIPVKITEQAIILRF